MLTENLLPPATWPTDALPGTLAWRRDAVVATLIAAFGLGLVAWVAARSGNRTVAVAVAAGAAAASLTHGVLWVSLAVVWADRVPGAGEAFAVATCVACALLAPAALLAAGALRAARRR